MFRSFGTRVGGAACALLMLTCGLAADAQLRSRPGGGGRLVVSVDQPCPRDDTEIVVCNRAEMTLAAQQELHRVARCVVGRWPVQSRRLLIGELDGGYQRGVRRFLAERRDCNPRGTLRFGGLLLAGAMAETLLAAQQDIPRRVAYQPSRPAFRVGNEADLMAVCTVRAEPEQAAALIASVPGSTAEAAAIRALTPRLSSCLASGQTGYFTPPSLRALLAMAAYRLSEHNGYATS